MPYIFIDDGCPEARDYDSNYLYYDENDLEQMQHVLELLDQRIGKSTPNLIHTRQRLISTIEKQRESLSEEQRNKQIKKFSGIWSHFTKILSGLKSLQILIRAKIKRYFK